MKAGTSLRQDIAVGVLGALAPALVSAQDPTEDIEQIVVTGSRIARPDFQSASPIVSVPAEVFVRTNATSVETAVSRLPQFVPAFGNTSNNPSNGGQGNLQLRGLGLTSTLVLLDGKRLTPANGDGSADVNVIPPALIESVEVITGGASAVYGSDAIAGVVNFKLKEDFEGLQFDGGYGQTERSDGTEYSAGITAGHDFAEGRGDIYGHIGYANRDAVLQGERRYSKVALSYDPSQGIFTPVGSGTLNEGRWLYPNIPAFRPGTAAFQALFAGYGYPAGSVPLAGNGFSFNQDGSLFTTGNRATAGSVANFRGELDPSLANDRLYTYNYAPLNYLQLPSERVTAYGRVSFDLTDDVDLYAQVMYTDYSSDQQLAPPPAMPILLPVTNPYIPADLKLLLASRGTPLADFRMSKRLGELGTRIAENDNEMLQGTAGLKGRLGAEWQYEAYVQAGAYDSTETQTGNALRSLMMELTYAPDGGLAACGGLDLFGLDSVSQACADYISVDATNRKGYDQTIVEASANGPVLSLPAGELRIAVGAMYKHDEFFYHADPVGSVVLPDGGLDITGFNGSDDVSASDHNTDLYVEALVPLLAGVVGAEQLDLVVGYRYSDYASAGGVDAYKGELLYQPVAPLRVRASYQHAVRAPSVTELYSPLLPAGYSSGPDDLPDPCELGSAERSGPDVAAVEALCIAQGVPAAVLPEFLDSDGEHRGVVGGNPDLEPETADTLTLGLVLQSWSDRPVLSGLRLSLDWYQIELEDAIVSYDASSYVPLCFDPRTNPGFDATFEFCRYFSRDPASGEMVDLMDLYRNLVGYQVSGVDAQLDWSMPVGPGEVSINWLISWMERFEVTDVAGLPSIDELGNLSTNIGGSLPEWKWNLNVGYAWNSLSTNLQWRYVDSMRDPFPFEDGARRIPSYDSFDFFASYEFDGSMLDRLTLRIGVENLTDELPPLLASFVQANTDPSQYDVLGRRYFVNMSYRF